jgi:hypothetical protein
MAVAIGGMNAVSPDSLDIEPSAVACVFCAMRLRQQGTLFYFVFNFSRGAREIEHI